MHGMDRLKGAYSLVLSSPSKLIAVRDVYGFRPLCFGKKSDGAYVVASESCALDAVGATFIRDVEPGEIVVFSEEGVRSIRSHCNRAKQSLCVFEYIYFARPDSVIDGISVHEARVRAGEFLAEDSPVDADIVIGVPDSGLDAAIGYSKKSGIPYEIGFIKNKYVGRTFISPNQERRENGVRIKLNPIPSVVKGKRVVMIDDSIVRGTTSARIVRLLREAGASEVHMRVSAPPFLNPCYYGTDIDSQRAPDRLPSYSGGNCTDPRCGFAWIPERGKSRTDCQRRQAVPIVLPALTGNIPLPLLKICRAIGLNRKFPKRREALLMRNSPEETGRKRTNREITKGTVNFMKNSYSRSYAAAGVDITAGIPGGGADEGAHRKNT